MMLIYLAEITSSAPSIVSMTSSSPPLRPLHPWWWRGNRAEKSLAQREICFHENSGRCSFSPVFHFLSHTTPSTCTLMSIFTRGGFFPPRHHRSFHISLLQAGQTIYETIALECQMCVEKLHTLRARAYENEPVCVCVAKRLFGGDVKGELACSWAYFQPNKCFCSIWAFGTDLLF